MAELYGSIVQELSGQIGNIATEIGTDEQTAGAAVATALPLILGGLSRMASNSDGALALFDALDEEEAGGSIANVESLLENPLALAAGSAMIGRMFGGREGSVGEGLGKAFDLGGAETSKLMAVLTPIVMGILGRIRREEGLDAEAMAGLLRSEEEGIRAESDELDGLMGMLDRDDDGSVLDDVAKLGGAVIGSGLLARMFQRD